MGSSGISEYRRLAAYKDVLRGNLRDLENIGHDLGAKALVLRTEGDTLALYARELDYYRGNEGIILLEGYEVQPNTYSMGKILNWTRIPENRVPFFRALSFSAGLIVFLLATFLSSGLGSGYKGRR